MAKDITSFVLTVSKLTCTKDITLLSQMAKKDIATVEKKISLEEIAFVQDISHNMK